MSLKRSKTTHSSVENSIEGIKHMLEVILTKVSSIESKCEGFNRRLDELEATVSATVAAAAAQRNEVVFGCWGGGGYLGAASSWQDSGFKFIQSSIRILRICSRYYSPLSR
ncbi:hypothetical protein BD560DRAFT_428217 [Blakeslea trispora]|nr:hypothetical protein BD560DRAFT_428217 [Blakeslea trispora]